MNQNDSNPNITQLPREEYRGPGQVSSAAGGYWLWSLPGQIVASVSAAVMVFKSGKFFMNQSEDFERNGEKYINKYMAEIKTPTLLLYAGGATALVMGVFGGIAGWNKAKKAKDQFERMQDQRDAAFGGAQMLAMENGALKEYIGQASGENGKRFVDSAQPVSSPRAAAERGYVAAEAARGEAKANQVSQVG